MLASAIPSRPPVPFADQGAKNTIPTASQIGVTPGAASLTDGFPPLTRTPLSAGGVPPFGQDMNGILNLATAWNRWQAAGGPVRFNADFAAAIGGYPAGAALASTSPGRSWISTVENNATDPDNGGANWHGLTGYGSLGLNGYWAFADGLILQWGYWNTYSGAPLQIPITFPIAFPNAFFVAGATISNSTTATSGISVYSTGQTQMAVGQGVSGGGQSSAYSFFWWALGR